MVGMCKLGELQKKYMWTVKSSSGLECSNELIEKAGKCAGRRKESQRWWSVTSLCQLGTTNSRQQPSLDVARIGTDWNGLDHFWNAHTHNYPHHCTLLPTLLWYITPYEHNQIGTSLAKWRSWQNGEAGKMGSWQDEEAGKMETKEECQENPRKLQSVERKRKTNKPNKKLIYKDITIPCVVPNFFDFFIIKSLRIYLFFFLFLIL